MSNRTFFTGDKHFPEEYKYLSFKHWPLGRELTKNDYVIILGDFGICWDNSKGENYWLDWFNDKPWTTLWVDGNHQNFPLIYSYPTTVKHLMRGQIFTLNDMTFFTMGGATSIDKVYRKEGRSWWPEEIPSYHEMAEGVNNLIKYNNKVDYVITHCLPSSILDKFDKWCPQHDTLNNYLEKMIVQEVDFKKWFCGHYHIDRTIDDKYFILYKDIIELLPNDEIKVVNNQ